MEKSMIRETSYSRVKVDDYFEYIPFIVTGEEAKSFPTMILDAEFFRFTQYLYREYQEINPSEIRYSCIRIILDMEKPDIGAALDYMNYMEVCYIDTYLIFGGKYHFKSCVPVQEVIEIIRYAERFYKTNTEDTPRV